jgi:hypothetical protein
MTTTTNSDRDALPQRPISAADPAPGDVARPHAAENAQESGELGSPQLDPQPALDPQPDLDDALNAALQAVVVEIDATCLNELAQRVNRAGEAPDCADQTLCVSRPELDEHLPYGRSLDWWRRFQAAQGLGHRRRTVAACVSLLIHAGLAVGAGWIMLSPEVRPDARDLRTHTTLGMHTGLGTLVLLDQAAAPEEIVSAEEREPSDSLAAEAPEPPVQQPDAVEPPTLPVPAMTDARQREPTTPLSSPARGIPAPRVETAVADAMIATTDALSRTRAERARFEHEHTAQIAAARVAAAQVAAAKVVPPTERWAAGQRRSGGAGASGHERPARSRSTESAVAAPSSDAQVTFAGAGASGAQSVVYAVDASGPMVTSLPLVLAELRRSVASLGANQRFSVVLFREGASSSSNSPNSASGTAGAPAHSEVFSPRLLEANAENKQALDAWLAGVQPLGRSNPLVGLELALQMQPQVVFLFSRSLERSGGGVWGQGLWATLDRLEELNPPLSGARESLATTEASLDQASVTDSMLTEAVLPESALERVPRAVQIQTIAFLDNDPTGTMQAIARRHGPRRAHALVAQHPVQPATRQSAAEPSAEPPPPGYRLVRRSEDLAEQAR